MHTDLVTDEQKISEILKRREYFDFNFPSIEGFNYRTDISFVLSNSCPSCGYMTIDMRCGWEICSFCFWEDDGQDNHDADKVFGGPNGSYSLTEHRIELFDWMVELRDKRQSKNSIEKGIGEELAKLDTFLLNKEVDRQLVLDQIELLTNLFRQFREIVSDSKPNWKFLTEKKLTETKPAYNNTMPKGRRS